MPRATSLDDAVEQLNALALELGVVVDSCGCCGSAWATWRPGNGPASDRIENVCLGNESIEVPDVEPIGFDSPDKDTYLSELYGDSNNDNEEEPLIRTVKIIPAKEK